MGYLQVSYQSSGFQIHGIYCKLSNFITGSNLASSFTKWEHQWGYYDNVQKIMIKDTTNHVTLDHEAEYHTENEIK